MAFSFPLVAFLWPALAAAWMRETLTIGDQLISLAAREEPSPRAPDPVWMTTNRIVLELTSVQLRDFSLNDRGIPTLVCAPFALHDATIVDFAPGHSLIAALQSAGLSQLYVTHWRSATPEMRFMSIDSYLAEINVMIDELDGAVNLIGLCQGGWMALVYAARFPTKVRRLVLVGAPVDINASGSLLSHLAADTPLGFFEELVGIGKGRVIGRQMMQAWPRSPDPLSVGKALGLTGDDASPSNAQLMDAFNQWYGRTVDLPGTYYLQVVDWLYKKNQIATGNFVALGHKIDLSVVRSPIFLLAGRDDDLVTREQLFAAERLVGTPRQMIKKMTAPCDHLGLFMGTAALRDYWPVIAQWLLTPTKKAICGSADSQAGVSG
jgi:poly(3-hydroxyalkanoate) synthetase